MSNGIYSYFDRQEGRVVYVGKDSHIDENRRHKAHTAKCKYNDQQINRVLQNNPDRYHYGVIIEGEFDEYTLNALEEYYIWTYNTYRYDSDYGFNFTSGGDGATGYKHTDEARKKISAAHKGKTLSEEHKANVSAAKKGKNLSDEHKAKLSAANSGERNPRWKNYARIIKYGFKQNKQNYGLRYKGKMIKQSINKERLESIANKLNKEEDNELFTDS